MVWPGLLGLLLLAGCRGAPATDPLPLTRYDVAPAVLDGRVIAVGIPGASAISPVGTFLSGGPIRDKPEFALYTQPGRVLDPDRILLASASKFTAPHAQRAQAP